MCPFNRPDQHSDSYTYSFILFVSEINCLSSDLKYLLFWFLCIEYYYTFINTGHLIKLI